MTAILSLFRLGDSQMQPKEIVRAALRYEGPPRLPVRMGSLGVDDTVWIPIRSAGHAEDGYRIDEWGCRWEKTDMHNMGQPRGHALRSVSEHEKLAVPDYSGDWRYADAEEKLQEAERTGLYTQVGIFMLLFERMHAVAGFENVLMALLIDPQNAALLADKVVEARLSLVRNCQERFGERLHSFSMSEDWGTQNAAFISVDLWRRFFLPRYRKIFAAMHEGGQDVWVHSCGKVNEIIEGFIEAGVDVVNLQQPRGLGIEDIGQRYRGRIAFESLADIQATLPRGDAESISADAQALGEYWMSPSGGFVFSDYGDGRAIGATTETKVIMYRAFSQVSLELYGSPLPEPAGGG
jgi:hypothetical protein